MNQTPLAAAAEDAGLARGNPEVSLGARLQQARQTAGLTQQELCQAANISYSTLAKIERGAIKAPSIFTIQQIAAVLQIGLDDLVGNAVPEKKQSAAQKRQSKSGVRFVYFDINGCLVRFFHRAFTMIAEESGRQADIIETAFWHYNDAVCRGDMPVEEFNAVLGSQFGLPEFDWRQYYMAAIDPIAEMHELLTWAAEYYHIGLLSNIMPGQIDLMLANGTLPNIDYSAIIDSSVVHAIKPEEKIFEIAQQKAGMQPGEILFVDDARANLRAAERLGWRVMWFDDYRPSEAVERLRDALELAN